MFAINFRGNCGHEPPGYPSKEQPLNSTCFLGIFISTLVALHQKQVFQSTQKNSVNNLPFKLIHKEDHVKLTKFMGIMIFMSIIFFVSWVNATKLLLNKKGVEGMWNDKNFWAYVNSDVEFGSVNWDTKDQVDFYIICHINAVQCQCFTLPHLQSYRNIPHIQIVLKTYIQELDFREKIHRQSIILLLTMTYFSLTKLILNALNKPHGCLCRFAYRVATHI